MMPKAIRLFVLIGCVVWLNLPTTVKAQEEPNKSVDTLRKELAEKEKRLKSEEERLKTLEKEVDAKIKNLNLLLVKIEEALKKQQEVQSLRVSHLVKTFEAMPPEEAARHLAALEKGLAAQVLFKMSPKKAGALRGAMDPQKAADLTEAFLKTEKKIPTP